MDETFLSIENIELWARVGVLEEERELGQLFNLDIFLWLNFDQCIKDDDLNLTIDYSILINDIKTHSKKISFFTIEKYSNEIVELIKTKYHPNRIKIILTKCKPPIKGFNGQVSIVKLLDCRNE